MPRFGDACGIEQQRAPLDAGCAQWSAVRSIREHFEVVPCQTQKRLGTERGFVAVKPNCSIQSYAPVLTAWKEFEPYEVVATTYQAISGAGKTFKDWPEMVDTLATRWRRRRKVTTT